METNHTTIRHVAETGGHVLGHVVAIVLGVVLTLVGLALGVTMVMLPVGLPVGLIGLMLVLWGLTASSRAGETGTR